MREGERQGPSLFLRPPHEAKGVTALEKLVSHSEKKPVTQPGVGGVSKLKKIQTQKKETTLCIILEWFTLRIIQNTRSKEAPARGHLADWFKP